MLIQSLQSGIFEKIVRAKNGRLVRVKFVVAEIEGRVYGRVLSAEPIEVLSSKYYVLRKGKTERFYLPVRKKMAESPVLKVYKSKIISPYFHSLEFFMSQMTRAPSYTERTSEVMRKRKRTVGINHWS